MGGQKLGWDVGDKAGIKARVRARVRVRDRVGLGLGPPTFRARATPLGLEPPLRATLLGLGVLAIPYCVPPPSPCHPLPPL